jgi:hypothetical protein
MGWRMVGVSAGISIASAERITANLRRLRARSLRRLAGPGIIPEAVLGEVSGVAREGDVLVRSSLSATQERL